MTVDDREWLKTYWVSVVKAHSRPYDPESLEEQVSLSVQFLSDTEVAEYVATLRGVNGDSIESGYSDKPLQSTPSEIYCEGTDSPLVGHNKGWVRYIANVMQLVGYYMLIHDGFQWGLLIKGCSDLLILYWALNNRLYDVIIVTAIFCVFNFQRLGACFL
ncbi:hypothetical protein [Synechococcus phage MA01]